MFCVHTNPVSCWVGPTTDGGAPQKMKSAGWNFSDARENFNVSRFLGEVSLRISKIRMRIYRFHSSTEYHQILEINGVHTTQLLYWPQPVGPTGWSESWINSFIVWTVIQPVGPTGWTNQTCQIHSTDWINSSIVETFIQLSYIGMLVLHIKCCFLQFFNITVALKNKNEICPPPKKKLKWRPWVLQSLNDATNYVTFIVCVDLSMYGDGLSLWLALRQVK